jgi:hypothetical protein
VGSALIHADHRPDVETDRHKDRREDGETDITKLIGVIRDKANMPKTAS